jgi:hypothetical protein
VKLGIVTDSPGVLQERRQLKALCSFKAQNLTRQGFNYPFAEAVFHEQ